LPLDQLKTAWDHLDDFVNLPPDIRQHYIRADGDKHGYVSRGQQQRFDGKSPERGLMAAIAFCLFSPSKYT